MIGDNNHDISAARAAHAGLAIGVLSRTDHREKLETNCDILFNFAVDIAT